MCRFCNFSMFFFGIFMCQSLALETCRLRAHRRQQRTKVTEGEFVKIEVRRSNFQNPSCVIHFSGGAHIGHPFPPSVLSCWDSWNRESGMREQNG